MRSQRRFTKDASTVEPVPIELSPAVLNNPAMNKTLDRNQHFRLAKEDGISIDEDDCSKLVRRPQECESNIISAGGKDSRKSSHQCPVLPGAAGQAGAMTL